MRLMQRFMNFMQGRYGFDELGGAIMVIALIFYVIAGFVWVWYARLALRIIYFALIIWFIFRMLSTNIEARRRENAFVKPAINAVTGFFSFNYKRLRDGRTHRYYHCPSCKAQLRVKNVKGEHTIRCPRCGTQFKKKIR